MPASTASAASATTPPLGLRLLLLLLVALLASAAALDRDARPRIDPELEDYVLDTGDKLKLRCQSSFPVRWEIPETAESVAIRNDLYERIDRLYIIHLEVSPLNFLQTGYYKCADNRTTDLEDGSKVASIYVYVRNENELLALDPDELILPLTANSGERLIIPCRPTAPNITVTLTRGSEEITDYNEVSFDPKVGFTLSDVTDNVEVTCTAKNGSRTSTRSFAVLIVSRPDFVPAPAIESPRHAIIGTTLEMNCSVPYDSSFPLELEWEVPDQNGINLGRIVKGNLSEVKIHSNESLAIRSLIVKDVSVKDEGYYKCSVNVFSNNKREVEKYIPVLKRDAAYVNLTVQGEKTNITANAGSAASVQWVVYYSAHPAPTIAWFDDEDKEIISNGKFEVHRDDRLTKLLVKQPNIEDTGMYKLLVENRGASKSEYLYLNVLGRPIMNISIKPLYELNQVADIVCSVVANPLPVIEWAFHPCNFQGGDEDCQIKASDNLSTDDYTEEALGRVQLRSTLRLKANHSGLLQSKACNIAQDTCATMEVKLLVTDVPNGFDLQGENQTVEGEKVEFNCSVSAYYFTDNIIWRLNGHPIYEHENIQVVRKSTLLSHRSTLTVYNVSRAYQGAYTCVVEHLNYTPEMPFEKNISLIVADVQAPDFTNKTNLSGNVKELAERQSWVLVCESMGLPRPTISWFKDKEPMKLKDNIDISDDGKYLVFKYFTIEDEGKYRCEASNRGGTIGRWMTLSLLDKPKSVNVGLVIGLCALALLLLVIIVFLFVRVRKEQKLRIQLTQAGLTHFEEGAIENLNMELGVEEQAELLPYDRKFEFPREKLKLGKTLGSGAFGVVKKAEACGIVEGGTVTPVAVKMVKRTADNAIIKALASELKIMVHLGRHLNVVNLLGACTKGLNKMELLVIVEYCRYGNLHNYLIRHRDQFIDQIDPATGLIDPTRGAEAVANLPNGRDRLNYAALSFSNSSHMDSFRGDQRRSDSKGDYRSQTDSSENFATGATEATFVCMTPTGDEGFTLSNNSAQQPDWRSNYRGDYKENVNPITTRDLLCFAFQVARGMEYLASRKVLHGDLAARNILLADNNVIKICDFGLAKSVYKDENYLKKENGPLPIKWMAIESIRDRIFSTQSDVWSFGIVLWEFFTLARTPYTGMAADEYMYKKLEDGYRMEKPLFATDDLYDVMMECWRARPILRPSFTELVERLGSMLEDSVRKHYVDLNDPYVQMNNRWQNESGHDYLGMLSSPTYSNMVSPLPEENEEPQRYQNIPRGAPTVVADSSLPGYLTMKSPSPSDPDTIFSPTRPGSNGGNVFKFHTPPQARRQMRKSEDNDHIELRPMLSGNSRKSDSASGNESDSDAMSQYTAVPSSRPVIPSMDSRDSPLKPTNQSKPPSFSNPSYSFAPDLVTSVDNYVNYPRQKIQKPPELIANMRTPTFSTFGRKPAQEMRLPANYANIPAQRAPLALSEADFNDPPYVN